MIDEVDSKLKSYMEEKIFPLYDDNIGGHGLDHIKSVIARSFEIIREFKLDVDINKVYVIASFHDIGYKQDPNNHEQVSSELFLKDEFMKEYFSPEDRKIISEAIVDHRASLEYEARSIYGKIVSSADRAIDVDAMLIRSLCFQRDKHKAEQPTLDEVITYSYEKLHKKYGVGGYAKMYYPDEKYQKYLHTMQELLNNEEQFRSYERKLALEINLMEDN